MTVPNKNIPALISAVLILCACAMTQSSAQVLRDCPPCAYGECDNGLLLTPPATASAALLGRGVVSSFGAMDASDVSRYTANSALAEGSQFIAGQTEGVSGCWFMRTRYGAAALPVFYSGALGVFARSVSVVADTEHDHAHDHYHDIAADYEYTANTFGVSLAHYNPAYGYALGGHLALTGNSLSLNHGLDDTHGDAEFYAAFGLDFRADLTDALSGRAYFINTGVSLGGSEGLVNQFGLIVNYNTLREVSGFWGLDLGAGLQKTGDEPFAAGISAELNAGRLFFARLGYEVPLDGWPVDAAGLGAGAGFNVGGVGMDWAYRLCQDGHMTLAVNAKLQIESLKKRRASENYALAQAHFGRKRYKKSMLYSARAVALDSTRWDARALLQKSDAEYGRTKRRDIAIIYGGNAKGIAIPYPPSPDALGGLSRYAAAVKSLRKDYPVNFTIDAGNMLGAGKNELTVEMVAAYYDLMGYDLIAPGRGEAAMGLTEFAATRKRPIPLVVTNLEDNSPSRSGISNSLLLTNDGYSVYVINLIGRSAAGDAAMGSLAINTASVRAYLKGQNAAGADLRVAVMHADLEQIKRLAAELPELDVIIAGDLEERLDAPLMAGRTLILSAGSGNKFAGCLTLKFDDGKGRKGRFTAQNRLYPIFQEITPDSAVERVTRLVGAAVKVDEGAGEIIPVAVSGVIPHLSDRGDGTQAFIKAVQSRAEYHLGEDIINSRSPSFSPASNRGAFIYGKRELMNGKLRMVDLGTMNGRTVSLPGKNVIEAAFSPADNFLYYIEADSGSDRGAIYRTRMYMYDALRVLERDGAARRDLSVSSDGAALLFCAKTGDRWHIYAADTSAAAAPTRITTGNADHRYPRLSPNGKIIAYLSDRTGFGGQMDLWTYDRDRSTHRQITVNANVRDFTWSDNSETIYFSAGANMFEISSVDITTAEAVFNRLIGSAPKAWSENTPRFIRYNGAAKIVYTRETVNGSRRIHWYDIAGQRDERVYAVGENEEWIE